MNKRILLAVVICVICLLSYRDVSAQTLITCVPRMVTITIGDNTPGNPAITLETELGCVYNVFTDLEGYEPINTPVIFSNVPYFDNNGQRVTVSGEGYIKGYQLTRLIQSQQLLYIIQFGDSELRLHPFEFETMTVSE